MATSPAPSAVSPPPSAAAQSGVKQSVFEGLFVHVLQVPPDGPLADALRRVGYDLRRQEAEYSGKVWQEAVALACRHAHPQLAEQEAMRVLGVRFIEGFLQTLAGRALGVVLPMLGPDGALRRLQRFMAMGVPALRVLAQEQSARNWSVEVNVPWALADFDAGLIEAGVSRTGTPVQVSVLERSQDRYLLQVRW